MGIAILLVGIVAHIFYMEYAARLKAIKLALKFSELETDIRTLFEKNKQLAVSDQATRDAHAHLELRVNDICQVITCKKKVARKAK
jgi:hypothetical protein